MAVVSSTDVVDKFSEVGVIPIVVLVPTLGLVVVLVVTLTVEEIIRSC